MALSKVERELVALGAALGSNCVTCIEYHVPMAREAGICDAHIAEAVRLADKVRQVPARKSLDAALGLLGGAGGPGAAGADCAAATAKTDGETGSCCG